MDNESNQLVADHRVGDYELVEMLGTGKFGSVFRARSVDDQRDFVVKLITITSSGDRRETIDRIQAAVRSLSALEHAHIVNVLEAFPVNSTRLAIVNEYVDATPLQEVLDDLSPEHLIAVVRQVLSALRAIHDEGFVHGDIKPSNILIGWPHDDEWPHAYLVDFDLMSDLAGVPPASGLIAGPEYASPERLAGDALSPASDIFSLGTVAFEAITGSSPFAAPTMAGVLRLHLGWSRPDMSLYDTSGYSKTFCRLVERMLDPDPVERVVKVADVLLGVRRDESDDDPDDFETIDSPAVGRRRGDDREVWVQSGVVFVDRPEWTSPRLLECSDAYALHAAKLNGAIAFSTTDNEIWLVAEDGPTKTFTISGEPVSLVATDGGERLVVSTKSGRTYEASSEDWLLRQRLPVESANAKSAQHAPAEGE